MPKTQFQPFAQNVRQETLFNISDILNLLQSRSQSLFGDINRLGFLGGSRAQSSIESALGSSGISTTGAGAALRAVGRTAVSNNIARMRAQLMEQLLSLAVQGGTATTGATLGAFSNIRQSELNKPGALDRILAALGSGIQGAGDIISAFRQPGAP